MFLKFDFDCCTFGHVYSVLQGNTEDLKPRFKVLQSQSVLQILSGSEPAVFFSSVFLKPHTKKPTFSHDSKQTLPVVWLALRMRRTVGASSWPTRSLCQFILLNHLKGKDEGGHRSNVLRVRKNDSSRVEQQLKLWRRQNQKQSYCDKEKKIGQLVNS